MKTAKDQILETAFDAWPGVWHACEYPDGTISLVGDWCVVATHQTGVRKRQWKVSGSKRAKKFADELEFLLNHRENSP